MKALITGGTGFLGANLVDGLTAAGHVSRILRRKSSRLEALEGLEYEDSVGDILDYDSLLPAMDGCDWVFHVAAVSDYWRQGVDWLYQVNVEGTKTVMRAAQAAGVKRVVYTSSVAALGVDPQGRPMDESHTFNIPPHRFRYGHSKHLAEQALPEFVQAGLEVVTVNPAVILGPRDLNRISGSIILEVVRGLVRFYLPGGVNFVAVEDVVAGHIAAAERGRVGERYILGGENLSHQEAIDIIIEVCSGPKPLFTFPQWAIEPTALAVTAARKVLGNKVPVNANQVRMSGQKIYVNLDKAKRELDLPYTAFATAVERAYNWYKDNDYL